MTWMILGICACSWFIGLMSGIQYRDWQYKQIIDIQEELDRIEEEYDEILHNLHDYKPVHWRFRYRSDKGTVINQKINMN